ADGLVQWEKTYADNMAIAEAVQQTSDNGYIIAGKNGLNNALVLKLDGNGLVQWEKSYGWGSGSGEEARSVRQTSDGGYVVAGMTTAYDSNGYFDIWVLKLDSSGAVQWGKAYGTDDPDYCYTIRQTAEGGYVVGGNVQYGPAVLLKLYADGSIQWANTYQGDLFSAQIFKIQQISGGYVAAGGAADDYGVSDAALVMKLDANGSIADCDLVTEGQFTVTVTNAVVTELTAASADSTAVAGTPSSRVAALNPDNETICAADQPTIVELISFNAVPYSGLIFLEWSTASEIDNAGFDLYRSELEDGEYVKITTSLLPAKGTPTEGASYGFVDSGLKNRRAYYYKLGDVDLNGTVTVHGPVNATPRRMRLLSK
ncbi:MAG: hypothetical protein GY850_43710, partial [bacterium]|nr:hypothetical protein [bacterium]